MTNLLFRGWSQVAVALVVQAVSAASIFTAYSVIALALDATFQPSNLVLMLGITATSLVSGLLSPMLGVAVDRFSLRRLMLLGIALLVSGFWLLSFARSMVDVLLVYAGFMAIASVLLGPMTASALLARWFTRRRGLALGIAASGTAIGGLLLPPLLQLLVDHFEWRLALRYFSAVLLLLTAPLCLLLTVDRPGPAERRLDADEFEAVQVPARRVSLRDPTFWLLAGVLGVIFCGPVALVSNLMPLLSERAISASTGVYMLSAFSAANFVGKLLLGSLGDRIHHGTAFLVILAVLALGGLGFLQAQSYSVLLVSCLLMGCAGGGATPLWSLTLARLYGPASIGKAMGAMSLALMPFTLVSAPLLGWVHDTTGRYNAGFIGYLGLLALGAVMALALRRQARD